MGVESRSSVWSRTFWFSGAFMFALRTKDGTARRPTTTAMSRDRLSAGDTALLLPPLGDRHVFQQFHVVERLAAPQHGRADRIGAHHDGKAGLFAEEHVDVAQERTAAGQHDPLVDDVRREL